MPSTAPLTHEFLAISPIYGRQKGQTSITTRPGFAGNGDGRWNSNEELRHEKYFAFSSVPLKVWDTAKDDKLGQLVAKHGQSSTGTSSTFGSPLCTKSVDWTSVAKEAGFFTTKESCEQRWAALNRPTTASLIADRVNGVR